MEPMYYPKGYDLIGYDERNPERLSVDLSTMERAYRKFLFRMIIGFFIGLYSLVSNVLALAREWNILATEPAAILTITAILLVGGLSLVIYTVYEIYAMRRSVRNTRFVGEEILRAT
jgi:hypothetical protein